MRRYFETNWAPASRYLKPGGAVTPIVVPINGETSGATVSSSPDCQESSICAPSSVDAKSTSEVDDTPQTSHPLLPFTSESADVPTSPKSAEAPTEVEKPLDSSCASDTVVGSIAT